MNITVNQKSVETQAQNIEELLESLNIAKQGTAVAAEGKIVPSSQWKTHLIYEHMTIDIFTLTAGG